LSPNVLSGGTKANVVPAAAAGELDVRLLPGQDRSDVLDHLRKVVGPDVFDDLEITPVLDDPANTSPTEGPLWDAISAAAETHVPGVALAPTMTPVTTDARFFRARGIPSYGVGLFDDRISLPEMLAMFHGADERVSVASIESTARFLADVVGHLAPPTSESP
jgi:acetylornithine deacetylase/succinyl-diaminopimelate desuccinylase-like protein